MTLLGSTTSQKGSFSFPLPDKRAFSGGCRSKKRRFSVQRVVREAKSVVDEAKRVDDEAKSVNFQMKVWVGQMKGWVWQMKVWVWQIKVWVVINLN